jgi:nucleotide-binding universal stress UspA family protein
MDKILVTTDFSDISRDAFEVTRTVAEKDKEKTKIVVLCVLEDLAKTSVQFAAGFTLFNLENAYERVFKDATAKVESIVAEHFSGLDAEGVVIPATGQVASNIIDFAKKEDMDLIVMATHGNSGVAGLILGSVTDRVIREASCPVLVVPPKASS